MLQQQKRSFAVKLLILLALCTSLYSFSIYPGGESFSIYVNNSLVVQQHVTREATVKSFTLLEGSANDVLRVHYNHCGKIGKSKTLSIKDAQNKTLKTWQFADDEEQFMTCKVNEVIALQKRNSGARLNLYYASKEIPDGKLLAAIVSGDEKARLE
jgi:hypothetical protein